MGTGLIFGFQKKKDITEGIPVLLGFHPSQKRASTLMYFRSPPRGHRVTGFTALGNDIPSDASTPDLSVWKGVT